MELLIVGFLIFVAWFFLSGEYSTNFRAPETLRDDELEATYINLKKTILVTNSTNQGGKYRKIYNRMTELLGQILERHQHFTLDIEAKFNIPRETLELFQKRIHHHLNGLEYKTQTLSKNLNLIKVDENILFYLCFFLYQGGRIKHIGTIDADSEKMLEILDHLINERKYFPAYFFKGLVMKYGVDVYEKPKLEEAKALLEFAKQNGIGSADIELRHINAFEVLNNITSIHKQA